MPRSKGWCLPHTAPTPTARSAGPLLGSLKQSSSTPTSLPPILLLAMQQLGKSCTVWVATDISPEASQARCPVAWDRKNTAVQGLSGEAGGTAHAHKAGRNTDASVKWGYNGRDSWKLRALPLLPWRDSCWGKWQWVLYNSPPPLKTVPRTESKAQKARQAGSL